MDYDFVDIISTSFDNLSRTGLKLYPLRIRKRNHKFFFSCWFRRPTLCLTCKGESTINEFTMFSYISSSGRWEQQNPLEILCFAPEKNKVQDAHHLNLIPVQFCLPHPSKIMDEFGKKTQSSQAWVQTTYHRFKFYLLKGNHLFLHCKLSTQKNTQISLVGLNDCVDNRNHCVEPLNRSHHAEITMFIYVHQMTLLSCIY